MDNKSKILFTGDVYIKNEPENSFISEDFARVISEHDIVSCNFETPVYTENARAIPKTASPHLFQHKNAANIVIQAGFNVIALATNHMYDYGEEALKNTLELFNEQITTGAGLDFDAAYKLKIKEINGIKIGFFAFCESEFGALTEKFVKRGGYAWVYHPSVFRNIIEAKKVTDVLIIQVHGGCEHTKLPVPETRELYQEFINLGADAVIAHHPHVPQGWEVYNEKPIFYSLGNLYFDVKSNTPLWNNGYAVSLTFNGKDMEKFDIIPTEKTREGVIISKDESYIKYLNNLSTLISDENYYNLANKQVLDHWFYHYSSICLKIHKFIPDNSFGDIIFKIFRKFIKLTNITFVNNLVLLHNIRTETHRWNIQRALSLIAEKDYYTSLKNDN